MSELKDGCPKDFGDGERFIINSMVNSIESQTKFAPLALSSPHSDCDRNPELVDEPSHNQHT